MPLSKSLIYLSFDGWTASNNIAYLDIVGHLLDANNHVKMVLLGIKHIRGSHTGDNLTCYPTKLIKDYRIKDNLCYFMLDNAENMNTTVISLCASLGPQFKPKERRCHGSAPEPLRINKARSRAG